MISTCGCLECSTDDRIRLAPSMGPEFESGRRSESEASVEGGGLSSQSKTSLLSSIVREGSPASHLGESYICSPVICIELLTQVESIVQLFNEFRKRIAALHESRLSPRDTEV